MNFRIFTNTILLGRIVSAYVPTVSETPQVIGLVQDPTINRDSCGSSRFGDRSLWVCRDSQPYDSDGSPKLPIWSSSASWTNFNPNGTLVLQEVTSPAGSGVGLLMYGGDDETTFYPQPSDLCGENTTGECTDGTRYALWPDQPPLVTSNASDTSVIAYTWIKQSHITSDLATLNPDPPVILYRIEYNTSAGDSTTLPTVTMVEENFWTSDEFPYGTYGGIVKDGVAYLYGQNAALSVGLASVPVASIEDKTAYLFYIDEGWATSNPGVNASGLDIPNVSAGGQGTFYYSNAWDLYVWIGQASLSIDPDFFVTTCASPEGPWDTPMLFYSAPSGNGSFGGYTLQAHPGLLPPAGDDAAEGGIYLTYTKPTESGAGVDYYTTPLVYVEWE